MKDLCRSPKSPKNP